MNAVDGNVPSSEDIKRDRPCFDRSFFVDWVRNECFPLSANS